MKKKVLFITPSLCQGGAERSQIIMLQMLDKREYDLTLYLYRSDMTLLPMVPKEVRVVIDNQTPHYYRRPKALWLSAKIHLFKRIGKTQRQKLCEEELRKYIHEQKARHPAHDYFRKEAFDVVVSNTISICTEMALYIQAKKRIVWYRASVDMHHEMLTQVFPQYDHIMAVSNGVKQMLSEQYPDVKSKVVLLQDFVSGNEILAKTQERCDIQIHRDRMTLCTCGRISHEKGFNLAVDAAAILKQKGLRFVWYFIGDGADRENLEKQIAERNLQNEIAITGFVDNPFPIMKQCDIYVQPSYEESFGRTIKEALILGKPVVSTNTPGAREILQNNRYGVITSIDAEGLANGILDIRSIKLESYTMEKNQEEEKRFVQALNFYLS